MQDPAIRLMAMLMEAGRFEEAASATLRLMLELAEQVLAASRYAGSGRIIRGMIHLRPEDGYRGLAVLEAGAGEPPPGATSKKDATAGMVTPLLASATAWQLVVEYRCAISIDVNLGLLKPNLEGAAPLGEAELGPAAGPSAASRASSAFLVGRSRTWGCSRCWGRAVCSME